MFHFICDHPVRVFVLHQFLWFLGTLLWQQNRQPILIFHKTEMKIYDKIYWLIRKWKGIEYTERVIHSPSIQTQYLDGHLQMTIMSRIDAMPLWSTALHFSVLRYRIQLVWSLDFLSLPSNMIWRIVPNRRKCELASIFSLILCWTKFLL